MRRILEIQDEAGVVDLTGTQQHGFRRKCSTATLSTMLQSQIARALGNEEYLILVSSDLSSAFDLVTTDLLLKRLWIEGHPHDCIQFIESWLKDKALYVSIEG